MKFNFVLKWLKLVLINLHTCFRSILLVNLNEIYVICLLQHKAIAEFPSKQFYHGKLEVGKAEQSVASRLAFWPAGGTRPIAFVHVEGREDALAVETEEGGEQSKMNEEEINNVVICLLLLWSIYKM